MLARGAHRLSYRSGLSAVRARLQGGTRILMFHGVDGEEYSAESFEAQLRYLRRHFSIVPISALLDRSPGQNEASSRRVVLTFDDGLHNHHSIVYPILHRMRVPATFYVCPGLIEKSQWLWNHEARERLKSLASPQRIELAKALGAPSVTIEGIVAWMKLLQPAVRAKAEETIRAASSRFEPTALQHLRFDIMSWEEIFSLDPEIVTVGSHTVNHPILTAVDQDTAAWEILESGRWLEETLKRPIEHFCYPNGENDRSTEDHVRRRYRTAVTTKPGVLDPNHDPHRLLRIPTADTLHLFAWRLHRPTA